MARFSTVEGIEYRAIRDACYQGSSALELLKKVNQRVQSVVGMDAFCANELDPKTMLLTKAISEGWPFEANLVRAEPS